MAKRYHKSKRHLSAHDKAMDRKNLKDARMVLEHEASSHPRDMHPSERMHHSPARGHSRMRSEYRDEYGESLYENPAERTLKGKQRYNDENHNDQNHERAVYRKFRALGNEFYAGMEPRRRQEMEDAGYLYEDHNAVANLPQNVIMRPYPHTGPYLPEGLEDSISGIDHQIDYDDSKRREHFYPKKV